MSDSSRPNNPSNHLRQKSSASSSYINFSRPRPALSSKPSQSSIPPLSAQPSQSSFNGIDPSLIPAPLIFRRPASQVQLAPSSAQAQVLPLPIPPHLRPQASFQSQATFGTDADSDVSSVHNSNLSSTDHFNLYHDPELDNHSEITTPWSEHPLNDNAPIGGNPPQQFYLENPYPTSLSPERAGSFASIGTFNLAPPPLQPPPPPQTALSEKRSNGALNMTKGDAWYPPRHPRIVKRVSFDQMSERVPQHSTPTPTQDQQPSQSNPPPRATRSLEYNRQGSFGSFRVPTTASTSSDTTEGEAGAFAAGEGLSGNGTGLKRQWSSSNYDVSSLGEKKLAKLKRKGINPALYMEMQAARRGDNGKRRWINPLVGNTYIG